MEREDLYAVLDLNNECTQGDLRLSYKNLVLKWHPDRFLEEIEKDEAKMKFQSIQRAYSVLSDSNKRLLYDVGAYDSDDDETGMADFINEMVTLMAQTQSTVTNYFASSILVITIIYDYANGNGNCISWSRGTKV
jgi:DnaJ-class molecular chaperone